MFLILPIENWNLIYKLILVFTIIFHSSKNVREFCFWFSISLLITGLIKCEFLHGKYWFMMQTVHELITVLLAGRFLVDGRFYKALLTLQAVGFTFLNLYQFQTFTPGFMPPKDYIWWNMLGFELILFTLWCREGIFHTIKSHWTFENVTMAYIMMCVVYLIGNY